MFVHSVKWLVPTLLEFVCRDPSSFALNSARRFFRAPLTVKAAQTGTTPFEIDGKKIIPPSIFAIGLNYATHAREMGKPNPEQPIVFGKSPNTLIASGEPIILPPEEPSVDYEGELAVIIGPEPCRSVTKDAALKCVYSSRSALDRI